MFKNPLLDKDFKRAPITNEKEVIKSCWNYAWESEKEEPWCATYEPWDLLNNKEDETNR